MKAFIFSISMFLLSTAFAEEITAYDVCGSMRMQHYMLNCNGFVSSSSTLFKRVDRNFDTSALKICGAHRTDQTKFLCLQIISDKTFDQNALVACEASNDENSINKCLTFIENKKYARAAIDNCMKLDTLGERQQCLGMSGH